MRKSLAVVLLISGLVGLFFSVREIIWEERIAGAFVPAMARIEVSQTPGLDHARSSTFFPIVKYRYVVRGTAYESSRIWPYAGTVYRADAARIMRDFPVGARAQAYVDPQDPADAVLVRRYSSIPYWPALASLVAAALGGGIVMRVLGPRRTTMQTRAANEFGWRRLLPVKGIAQRFHEAAFLFAAIGLTTFAMAARLWAQAGIGSSFYTFLFVLVSLGTVLDLGFRFYLALRLTQRIGDLRLIVNAAPMRLDESFIVRVEADVRSRIQFSVLRARVVCIRRNLLHHGRRTHLQTIVLGQRVMRLTGKSAVPRGEVVKGIAETMFRMDQWPPSGREGVGMYPYTVWELRVEAIGPTHFLVTYPLEVVVKSPAEKRSFSEIE